MKLRRRVLIPLGLGLILLVGLLFFFTRPPPVLTVMTWPGAYGRAQANAQMHPYAARNNVDVRPAIWDGDLEDVRAMVDKRQFKADVIDFELPKAVQACKEGLLEKIDPAILPDGADGMTAAQDFVPGAIGPCWVGSMVYSQVMVFAPSLKRAAGDPGGFLRHQEIPRPPGAEPRRAQVQSGDGAAGRRRGAGRCLQHPGDTGRPRPRLRQTARP